MPKHAVVILANGAEEMEFVICVDVLRRAGINTTVASLLGTGGSITPVKCSREIVILPDTTLDQIDKDAVDCIVLPGGLDGSKAMAESALVGDILKHLEKKRKYIAAICAAPTVLLKHGIGMGKRITSYPYFKKQLEEKYQYDDENLVVQDEKLITSRGPYTAFAFALKIAEELVGEVKTKQVANGMLVN